jgi:hypothetical protein
LRAECSVVKKGYTNFKAKAGEDQDKNCDKDFFLISVKEIVGKGCKPTLQYQYSSEVER